MDISYLYLHSMGSYPLSFLGTSIPETMLAASSSARQAGKPKSLAAFELVRTKRWRCCRKTCSLPSGNQTGLRNPENVGESPTTWRNAPVKECIGFDDAWVNVFGINHSCFIAFELLYFHDSQSAGVANSTLRPGYPENPIDFMIIALKVCP